MPAYLTFVSDPSVTEPYAAVVFTDTDATVVDLSEETERMSDALQAVIDLRLSDKNLQSNLKAVKDGDRAMELAKLVFTNTRYITGSTQEFETEEEALESAYRIRGSDE